MFNAFFVVQGESLVESVAAREEDVRDDGGGRESGGLESLGQGFETRRERGSPAPGPVTGGVFPGEQRCDTGKSPRRGSVGPVEYDCGGGEAIQLPRCVAIVSVRAQVVRAQGVDRDEQQIGRGRCRWVCAAHAHHGDGARCQRPSRYCAPPTRTHCAQSSSRPASGVRDR